MTVMLLATCDCGVAIRVAVTTTLSMPLGSAAAALAKAVVTAAERILMKNDLRTTISWFGSRSRHANAQGRHLNVQPRLRDDDSYTVAATVLPRCHQRTPAGNKTTARG